MMNTVCGSTYRNFPQGTFQTKKQIFALPVALNWLPIFMLAFQFHWPSSYAPADYRNSSGCLSLSPRTNKWSFEEQRPCFGCEESPAGKWFQPRGPDLLVLERTEPIASNCCRPGSWQGLRLWGEFPVQNVFENVCGKERNEGKMSQIGKLHAMNFKFSSFFDELQYTVLGNPFHPYFTSLSIFSFAG